MMAPCAAFRGGCRYDPCNGLRAEERAPLTSGSWPRGHVAEGCTSVQCYLYFSKCAFADGGCRPAIHGERANSRVNSGRRPPCIPADDRVVKVSNLEPSLLKSTRRRSDSSLVVGCLNGDEEAWTALLDKYKNLIFSIPVNLGVSQADARDIFQSVTLDLLTELPHLRNPDGLPKWLIQTTTRRCWRWKRREEHYRPQQSVAADVFEQAALPQATPEEMLAEVQLDQVLRDAIAGLSPRCRQIVHMLFYEAPARPYSEVATTLGVATGSIGFLRRRCLRGLRRQLKRSGFERGTGRSGRDPGSADG